MPSDARLDPPMQSPSLNRNVALRGGTPKSLYGEPEKKG
jgi:hypothetical protein